MYMYDIYMEGKRGDGHLLHRLHTLSQRVAVQVRLRLIQTHARPSLSSHIPNLITVPLDLSPDRRLPP
jgi:hypothetical protein